MKAQLAWGEDRAHRVSVSDGATLRSAIVERVATLVRPVILTLSGAHKREICIGLTGPKAILLVQNLGKPVSHEWITVGDIDQPGTTDYWLLDSHHTEWENRHLIPLAQALQILEDFLASGKLSSAVSWEENTF